MSDDSDPQETLLWGVILLVGGGFLLLFGGGYCIGLRFGSGCLLGGQTFGALIGLLGAAGLVMGYQEYQAA